MTSFFGPKVNKKFPFFMTLKAKRLALYGRLTSYI